MTGNVAADIDRHRKPGNMGGIGFYIDGQRRCLPAESLRTDIQGIDLIQHLFFHAGIKRIRIPFGNTAAKRFFCKQSAVFKINRYTYSTTAGRDWNPPFLPYPQQADNIFLFGAGVNILSALIFSLPKPLGAAVMRILSPGTIRVCKTAGVLSFVLTRSKNGSRTTDFRNSPSVYPSATPRFTASSNFPRKYAHPARSRQRSPPCPYPGRRVYPAARRHLYLPEDPKARRAQYPFAPFFHSRKCSAQDPPQDLIGLNHKRFNGFCNTV